MGRGPGRLTRGGGLEDAEGEGDPAGETHVGGVQEEHDEFMQESDCEFHDDEADVTAGEPRLSANDRNEVREEAVGEGKKRYRLYKKTAASRWLKAVSKSVLLIDVGQGRPNAFCVHRLYTPVGEDPPLTRSVVHRADCFVRKCFETVSRKYTMNNKCSRALKPAGRSVLKPPQTKTP